MNRSTVRFFAVFLPLILSPAAGIAQDALTDLNADLLDHKTLGQVEELWCESSYDERPVQGWIVKPPGFDPEKRYPLLLEIHGGPFANYGPRFAAEIQLFAAAGYVVLYMNPRGSTSYGQEFGNLIHHAYPGNDYDDLMSGVDALLDKGYVDPERLYVTGGSGGGVLLALQGDERAVEQGHVGLAQTQAQVGAVDLGVAGCGALQSANSRYAR